MSTDKANIAAAVKGNAFVFSDTSASNYFILLAESS
jgi:hypothetical protein